MPLLPLFAKSALRHKQSATRRPTRSKRAEQSRREEQRLNASTSSSLSPSSHTHTHTHQQQQRMDNRQTPLSRYLFSRMHKRSLRHKSLCHITTIKTKTRTEHSLASQTTTTAMSSLAARLLPSPPPRLALSCRACSEFASALRLGTSAEWLSRSQSRAPRFHACWFRARVRAEAHNERASETGLEWTGNRA